ncbi:alpha/beta hydrolase [Mycobacterium cookii]|uniref:Esterase n=1 Tax=Mycobacterium cookii TaxID=1775 RepID=A0A7I7KWZ6_9MYCO|nr:alpha/beta hydrolase [Mycobacterium cookii]MCV7330805.1 alpha/beta hydrolase [Mycobacterium cookii]BBX46600.1 esterase [Mycobacterium cookii]
MSLDPQLAPLIEDLDAGFPPVHTMTGAQARATIRSRFVPPPAPEAVAEVRNTTIPGPGGDIPIRIYVPLDDRRLPIVVYAHGGGFVFCDLDSHDGLCRNIANRVPALVISVAYRLAPENQWPDAAEDVYAVTRWAAENAGAIGGDANRIVVGGDSAGGNLAAVTTLMARDREGPPLAGQLLLYPVIAADFDTESYRLFGEGFYNPRPAMQWYWDQYVPATGDRDHPYASPLRADLVGLPPAIVVVAGHDPLRDEGIAYAHALEAAGVETVRCLFEGGVHGFMTMPMLDIAHEARRQACVELDRLLGHG